MAQTLCHAINLLQIKPLKKLAVKLGNYYVNYYRNTFQHGGVSLEEMIIPVVKMSSKF